MAGAERDSTQDWLVPAAAAPPLLGELEARVDEAVARARASEEAARVIGSAAVDAAGQARRAAELAERASRAAEAAVGPGPVAPPVASPIEDARLRGFTERADRVMARLHAVEERLEPMLG